MLALFYLVIDIWKFQAWAFPFVVIGANPLFIYLASDFVLVSRFGRSFCRRRRGRYTWGISAMLVNALVQFALQFAVLLWLYRRKIFIRI